MGMFVRTLNTFYLENSSYRARILINTLLLIIGLVTVSLSTYVNFYVAVLGVVFVGGSSSFGESVLLGYLKAFAPELSGAWSSGTGMAGVGGSLFYLALFSGAALSNEIIFMLLLPTAILYWFAFVYVEKTATKSEGLGDDGDNDDDENAMYSVLATSDQDMSLQNKSLISRDVADSSGEMSVEYQSGTYENDITAVDREEESTFRRTVRVLKGCGWLATQLLLVYFFEYVVSVGFAAIANKKQKHKNWFHDNSYELLAFCYQFGVLISRSSISFIKIRQVEILTFLQGCNFVIWLLHSFYFFIPLEAQFPLMIFCGLLGGAMYVNVFYILLETNVVPSLDRELAINLTAIFINIGIVMASGFMIYMDKTFLKDAVDEAE